MRAIGILYLDAMWATLRSVRLWLFLLPFGLFWYAVLRALAGGASAWLESQEGNVLAAWLLSPRIAEQLFAERPPTLSAFFLLAMGTLPAFALLATFDQTSSERASGYLRFLATRVSRLEIFASRLFAAWTALAAPLLVVLASASILCVAVDGTAVGEVVLYAARIAITLLLYAAALAAFMSPVSAAVASGAFSALLGMSIYALVVAGAYFAAVRFPGLTTPAWLLPSALKPALLTGGTGGVVAALAGITGYALVFAAIGLAVFRRRDL